MHIGTWLIDDDYKKMWCEKRVPFMVFAIIRRDFGVRRLQRPVRVFASFTPHPRSPAPLFFFSLPFSLSLVSTKAGQTHSPKFSTSSRHSTKKRLQCSWLAWECSERSRRRDQMSCVGLTGSSFAWWVTRPHTNYSPPVLCDKKKNNVWLTLLGSCGIQSRATSFCECSRIVFWWASLCKVDSMTCTMFKQCFVSLGFSVRSSASSIKMILHPSSCQSLCPSTHR